ncbi:MAG: AAA family ATPase [Lentisphaerae bacterium]|nr:AAA family ATPase [Lentisphaerota bacterium]
MADARFAYLCAQHHEGLARLVYLAQNRKLGGILTGPYGIGKSMVLELLAQEVGKDNDSSYIGFDYVKGETLTLARHVLAMMGFAELVQTITTPFDAVSFLRQKRANMKHTVLAIDEAQAITDNDTFDFLQLLLNISLVDRKMQPISPAFTLILAGYIDAEHLMFQKESLCQRLQIAWTLEPLNQQQVVEYVQHRIRVAGGDIWLFDQEALDELAVAGGIPRMINNICDVALMLGYAANVRQVNRSIMQQAVQEVLRR